MTAPASHAPTGPADPFAVGEPSVAGGWGTEPPSEPRDLPGALKTFGVALVALTLVGAPLGVLWAVLAPSLDLGAVAEGSEDAFRVQLSADLVLALLTLLAGTAAGLLAWSRRPRHGASTVLGLAVGGLLAALVAARVGYLYALPGLQAAVRPDLGQETLDLITFRLRARAVLVVLPLMAVGVFGVLTARWHHEHDPHPGHVPPAEHLHG